MQNLNSSEVVKVSGEVPQPRFGHTITLVSKTKAVLFGGATGDTGKYSITGETFVFDCILRKWRKLEPSGSSPTQRAAHASTAVEESQLVIYGGATGGGGLAPDDLYLLDLRSGEDHAQWMIVPVVGTTPGRRYGHTIAFTKPFLMVFGGNTGNEAVNDVWTLNVEKAPHFWTKLECEGEQPPTRVYHSSALCSSGTANGMIVIFGGRTQDQSALNDSWGLRRHRNKTWDWVRAPYRADATPPMARYQHSALFLGSTMLVIGGRTNNVGETVPLEIYDCESSNWQRVQSVQRFRHACWLIDSTLYVHGGFEQDSPNIPTDTIATFNIGRFLTATGELKSSQQQQQQPYQIENYQNQRQNDLGDHSFIGRPNTVGDENATRNRRNNPSQPSFKSQGVRMSPYVWVVTPNNMRAGQEIIRNVLLENLPEESKKLAPDYNITPNGTSLYYESIYNPFINGLLKPARTVNPSDKFPFKKEQIHKLIDECMRLFDNIDDIPNVLRIKIPLKIFGSLHGQYTDLMRLFDNWGAPSDDGDIEGFDYLFLGNYVDRGRNSLEVLCLLFSLKLKYPEQLHLLRGSHEDVKINKNFGFGEECINRLGEDINDPNSVFQRFNKLFEYLPLAAVIQNKIFCAHSGIGNSVRSIQDIESINRPIEIVQESDRRDQQILSDLLWSDPIGQNEADPNIQAINNAEANLRGNIKFGPERLKGFLMDNGLSMMIRSHECVLDGFEKSWNGSLLTLFSTTDYCGKGTNAAAVVVIKKNSELTPKVIYQASTSKGSFATNASYDDDRAIKSAGMGMKTFGGGSTNMSGGMGITMGGGNSNWLDNEESLKKRPATPPRYVTSKGNTKK